MKSKKKKNNLLSDYNLASDEIIETNVSAYTNLHLGAGVTLYNGSHII